MGIRDFFSSGNPKKQPKQPKVIPPRPGPKPQPTNPRRTTQKPKRGNKPGT